MTEDIWISFEEAFYRALQTQGRTDSMRAALEAVAPMILEDADRGALLAGHNKLVAKGMREAANIAVGAHDPRQMTMAERLLAIYARAQELDPK